MIELTALNGKDFYLNNELIYKIEESPDTIITLVDGKKLRVKDSPEDIVKKVIAFKREIHTNLLEGV